jgi:hypothetical protein
MIAKLLLFLFLCMSYGNVSYAQESPLPAPTGSYAVGRTLFDWTDESRVDLENANGHREIMVWVWYPASPPADAERAEWLPGIWGDIFAASPELAPKRTNPDQPQPERYPIHTLRSNSYSDAPVSSALKKYPILLFAPGYGSSPTDYANLIEDIVSHGYIVAGVVPTYFSSYTVFSDGRVAGQHPMAREVPGAPRSSWGGTSPVPEPIYRLWTGDLRFSLNQLEKLNADEKSPLKGRLDFDHVGALGHSIGATATAQVVKDDRRIRAAILIEGTVMGDVSRNPEIPKPLLLMLASSAKGRDRASLPKKGLTDEMIALLHSAKPFYIVTIAGTSHPFPSDMGLMPFAKDWRHDANPSRALAVTKAYVEAFFDQHLLGRSVSLLNGPSPDFPEATFENTLEKK